jgi:prolyl oligopeptidase
VRTHRQVGFDDFIAAAEWLCDNRYTSRSKLAIAGDSNGGLLVGACLTQRPHLFGAVLVGVGVLDMLRFPQSTLGWGWIPEYGDPDEPAEFPAILAYSPLHNVRPGTSYPATLILTGDHDDRVAPWHSFKFTAAMQAAQAGPKPILIRVETQVGHGGDTGLTKTLDEYADRLAFVSRALGMDTGGMSR